MITWRDFVKQQRIDHVDLFTLDVEGHELAVIEGMKDCAVLPDVLCVAAGHLESEAFTRRWRTSATPMTSPRS
ncbi:MAG: FkbM family methyltransferase [Caulobacteraceae bacterium]